MKKIFLFATLLLLMVKPSISQDFQDGVFCYTHDKPMVCGANEDGHYVPSVFKICFPQEPEHIYTRCEEQVFVYHENTLIIISQNHLDVPSEVEPFLQQLVSDMEESSIYTVPRLVETWDKKDYAIIKIEEFMIILINIGTTNRMDLLNIIGSFKIISHETIKPWVESVDTPPQKTQ